MSRSFIILVLSFCSFQMFADTYTLDRSRFSSEEDYQTCKDLEKESFSVVLNETKQIHAEVLNHYASDDSQMQLIQDEKGNMAGGKAYQGAYVDRVYLVKMNGRGIYKYGLYYTLRVVNYANGIEIFRKPLNYLSMPDVSEGYSCSKIYYKLN